MKESTQKEKVLKKIRDALVNEMRAPFEQADADSSVYYAPDRDFPEVAFAEAFAAVGGQFVFCADMEELAGGLHSLIDTRQLHPVYCADAQLGALLRNIDVPYTSESQELASCVVSVTACEALICRLGSIVLSSRQAGGRKSYALPPVHVVVATTAQLVNDVKDAFRLIQNNYPEGVPSMITFATGPSRTADIEKKLVKGVHGPAELFLFLLDSMPDKH